VGLFSIYLLLKVKMKQQLNEVQKLQKIAGVLKEDIQEDSNTNEKGGMNETLIDGGIDRDGEKYQPYELEVDSDTFTIIQGENIISISVEAAKELAEKIINDSL